MGSVLYGTVLVTRLISAMMGDLIHGEFAEGVGSDVDEEVGSDVDEGVGLKDGYPWWCLVFPTHPEACG